MYSQALLDHFQNPRNVGELKTPSVSVEVSNPACGDMLRLSILLEGEHITQVAFKARGCTASIAACSALTELMMGKTIRELAQLTAGDVEKSIGGLIAESKHAAVLAIDGLKAVLNKLRSRDAPSR
jgi:nitrogen fixation NifU-like protein